MNRIKGSMMQFAEVIEKLAGMGPELRTGKTHLEATLALRSDLRHGAFDRGVAAIEATLAQFP